LLNPNTKVEEIDEILKILKWQEKDDITRNLYFHIKAFRGIAEEKQDVEEILKQLGGVTKKSEKVLSIPDKIRQKEDKYTKARGIAEKVLHRLLLIGVISDYTINYSRKEFTVKLSGASKEEILETYGKYVASYLDSRKQTEIEKASQLLLLSHLEFIMEMINLLLHFIYDVIERRRREALYQILLICEGSPSDVAFRRRVLTILEETEYSKILGEIVNDKEVDVMKVKDLFGKITSTNQAAELRGEVSRYLGDYPDHPSLCMLRALSEIFSDDKNLDVVKQYFMATISFAFTKYGLSDDIVFDFATWAVSNIARRDRRLAKELIFELTKSSNRFLARTLIEKLPVELTEIPAWFLLSRLEEDCNALVFKIGG
jgi:ATP-dependent DNA helicase RecQ